MAASAAQVPRLIGMNGIPVFPVRADKTPLVKAWRSTATTDAQTIERWWSRWPDALVAVPTGRSSGLWVLDVDPEGENWATEHSALLMAAGRCHYTRRGRHYLFTHEEGIRNSQSSIAPGIDVRGEGGYIVWWPAQGLQSLGEIEDIAAAPIPLLDIVRPTHNSTDSLAAPQGCGEEFQNHSEIGDTEALYSQKKIEAPNGTLDLFERRIPHRPYAADELGPGLRRMSDKQALKRRHLQINPPSVRFWLAFDIDAQGGAMAWDEGGLPEPAWTAQNPANGHAHSVWGIEAPVLLDKPDRQKPVRYLAAIESAYRDALGADPSYSGLLTKNPLSPHWRTCWGKYGVYGLHELAEYVDLDRHKPRRSIDAEQIGLGRNVALFDWLRLWAYRSWRRYKLIGATGADFSDACRTAARERNGEFRTPLHDPEVMQVAKSVSRWVWHRFTLAEFERIQRKRGQSSGAKRKNASQARRERLMPSILEMVEQGHSQQVIADTVGVSQMTVSRWLRS